MDYKDIPRTYTEFEVCIGGGQNYLILDPSEWEILINDNKSLILRRKEK